MSAAPALLLPFVLASQPAPEFVVTGRGLEAPPAEAVYDVVTLDRDRLEASPSNRLEDVLRDIPGFQLFRRSDARSANPTSQGATLRALGGNASSRALLTLDGVPQTDPFGGWISWPAFDPRRLGRVRVVRGGGSGTAGPGALAGTIELESAAPEDGLSGSAAYGSRDSLDAFAAAGVPLGRGFLTVTGSYAAGDGFIPVVPEQRGAADRPAPYEQASATFRAAAPVADALELQASGLLFHDARERGTAFSDIVTDGADASIRLVGSGHWRFSALAYLQARSFYNSFAAANAARTVATRTSEQFNVPSTGLGARFELRPPMQGFDLRLGADARAVEGETRERFAFQNGLATRRRVAGGRTRTVGAFAEAAMQTGPFLLTAGGRIDRWGIEGGRLAETLLATDASLRDERFADRSGWEPTARGGIAWRATPRLTFRAAAYLGWRLPTLNELYRPFRIGPDATAANAALEPERLRGVEAGVQWSPLPLARIAITAFTNRLENGIANVTLGSGPGIFPGVGFVPRGGEYRQRRNLDSIHSSGIEVDLSVRLGRWRLGGGYSYADAEVAADGEAAPLNGLRPAQTPRHAASLSLGWRPRRGADLFATARYTGPQFEDDLNQQLLPAAFTMDAGAVWPLARGIALEARAENLFDERVVAGISGNGIVEQATPRTFWIGLRFGGNAR